MISQVRASTCEFTGTHTQYSRLVTTKHSFEDLGAVTEKEGEGRQAGRQIISVQ